MESIDDDWESFLQDDYGYEELPASSSTRLENNQINNDNSLLKNVDNIPKASDIYISTKTKICYLNKSNIDIKNIFWNIPVLDYSTPTNGVIKKQIKYSSIAKDETDYIEEQLKNVKCYEQQIIEHIENPEGRIKYKDQRKISIGTCKKDLLSYRTKQKRAFFNCFVVIMRILVDDTFKELHIKVFNTGKMEVPGIQSDKLLENALELLVTILRPFVGADLSYLPEKNETVLINSNFNCGYYIDRDKLYDLLKYKYRLNSNFDACSYPGIQCKFYYDNTMTDQNGQQPNHTNFEQVSFMIFRTGSVLIVGKCEEFVLYQIYDFIKTILETEYNAIHIVNNSGIDIVGKIERKKKIRKKTILIDIDNDN
jgi:hypothetical protein|tara:strand:- start:2057 stop:3160 length:1104 start_codon:yes stop_codon:yes gene_type:complete